MELKMDLIMVEILVGIVVAMLLVASCAESYQNSPAHLSTHFSEVTYDGHRWMLYNNTSRGGVAHHPDCPCKETP